MRIAESVYNTSDSASSRKASGSGALAYDDRISSSDTLLDSEDADSINSAEKRVLDNVAEALARLGRAKRVGLGVKDKEAFIKAYVKAKGR